MDAVIFDTITVCSPCADPEGTGASEPPLENHKNIGLLSNIGPDSLATYASVQCRAIIGPLAKRHLNTFHWCADDDPTLNICLVAL